MRPVACLLLTACSVPYVPSPATREPAADLAPQAAVAAETGGAVDPVGGPDTPTVALVAPAACLNPCAFAAVVQGEVAAVRYDADGWALGTGAGPDHALSYSFDTLGLRVITATAVGEDGVALASDALEVEVDETRVLLDAADCVTPCTFRAEIGGLVERVRYDADGWALGEGAGPDLALTYSFLTPGQRVITATGLDADGAVVAVDTASVHVAADELDLPYFYQYANALYPTSSCQNTSVAMLLAGFGWVGEPDDLTSRWGKDYAQSPWGLADLFNTEAAAAGISARLTADVSGDLAGMRALLDAGKPVILHGYFTGYGHVLVVLGYDDEGYLVNDPAGTWNEAFMGIYPYGWEPTAGDGIRYDRDAFEAAASTVDGWTVAPMWYHALSEPL